MTTGRALLMASNAYVRGYRAGWRGRKHPYRWARVWVVAAALAFTVSLGASVAITVTSAELALANVAIGTPAAVKKIGKIAAWLRMFRGEDSGSETKRQ